MDNRIVFIPSETVSFQSLTQKQTVQLSIKNNWDRAIIFKMKTTRPLLFKMRPVFGMVEKGTEKQVRLIFKGFGENEKPPCTRDRFTIVVAPAPEGCVDPSRVWKQQKCPEVLTQTARKVLKIEYGEPDNSKLVSVYRPNASPLKSPAKKRQPQHPVDKPWVCKFDADQLEFLRQTYPGMAERFVQRLPLSALPSNGYTLDWRDKKAAAAAAALAAKNNNNNKSPSKDAGNKKGAKEESSSSSSSSEEKTKD